MLEEISFDQFAEWRRLYAAEPFGEERADLRMGQICAIIANVNRSKRSDKVFSATDFMFKFGGEKADKRRAVTKKDQWADIKSRAKGLAVALNTKPKRAKRRKRGQEN